MSNDTKKAKSYPGRGITVRYSATRCIHAAECVRGLPEVFDPGRKPWVQPDEASPDRVVRVVARCPTGALWAEDDEGERLEERPQGAAAVRVDVDGPLLCFGAVEVRGPDGERICDDPRSALCRCGQSSARPFCDGSHSAANFRDPGRVGDPKIRKRDATAETHEALRITVARGGPLVLDGPFELVGSDGVRHPGWKTALCRCGASAEKPFCDGSHRDVGFETDDS